MKARHKKITLLVIATAAVVSFAVPVLPAWKTEDMSNRGVDDPASPFGIYSPGSLAEVPPQRW